MHPRYRAFSLFTCLALLLAACGAAPANPTPSPEANVPPARVVISAEPTPSPDTGLVFDLSLGADQPEAGAAASVAPAGPLPVAETQAILNRLPALEPTAGDAQPFKFPAQTLPAPRPGATIQEPFPPPAPAGPPPETAAGPLEVLRYAPEGDVPLAPNLNLTFNQPMVALTGLADLAAKDVPVKLSPQPAGQWRWVGTKTLVFEPAAVVGNAAGRFPMATKYTVTVPAGTKSAVGGVLAKAVTFTFTTPPPQVQSFHPGGGPTTLEPLLFVAFDQRVDPAAVLKTIALTAGGEVLVPVGMQPAQAVAIGPDGKIIPTVAPTPAPTAVGARPLPLRLATEEEVAADRPVKQLAAQAQPGYWLAFRPVEPLTPATQYTVSIGPGTPSAEGPLTTTGAQTYAFYTYGPLKVVESRCGWDNNCAPFMPWSIRFSNPLDAASVTTETVRITPELPAATINVYGDTLQIQGRSAGRTTYTVQLSANLRDTFGQTLGRDQSVSFAVGPAQPSFYAAGGNLIVLDPAAKPVYSIYTINYSKLAVQAYAVTPDDWAAFKTYQQNFYRNEKPPTPPGKLVLNTTVPVEARTDALTETAIDLSKALPGGIGHLIVVVQGQQGGLAGLAPSRDVREAMAYAWIQATKIGLDAFVDGEQMLAWANSLTDGAPLAGVKLQLWPGDRTGATAADGTATVTLPAGRGAQLLVGRLGDDVAFLPANVYAWGDEGWQQRPRADSLAWYVFDDRGLYRPGEEVHVKGWIRRVGAGPRGDVGGLRGAAEFVTYTLNDSRGNQVASGRADLNALGGFDFKLTLAETMNLGDAYLQFQAAGGSGGVENGWFSHPIPVQEFRRPEFEVKATASEGPHFVGAGADLEVSAAYYAGGGLPNADVTWVVTSQPGAYSPPGWDDFTFGRWTPWWRFWGWGGRGKATSPLQEAQTFTGVTDAAGIHRLRIDFRGVTPPEPSTVRAEATVMDVNRQAWTGTANLLVHPAALYVGLRTERIFVAREEPLPVDIIVTDLDGAAVAGVAVELKAERLVWQQRGGEWREVPAATQTCKVVSAKEPARCTVETPEGGTYRITATVTDAQGRPNRTELTRWVAGGERPPAREVEQEEATLIPDKKDYQPGDVAEILVQSPFYPAEGVLTLRRSGLARSERFSMDGSTITLRVPIQAGYIPNVHVQVDLVGAAERTGDAAVAGAGGVPGRGGVTPPLPKRPAYAMGELNLLVPPLSRTLSVEASPQDEKLEPGGSTTVDVQVRDAAGKPVAGAELAVVIVDEAILALTGYDIADPVAVFYTERGADVADHHSRASILLASPDQIATDQLAYGGARGAAMPAMAAPAPGATKVVEKEVALDAAAQEAASPIALRTDFNPLAHWSPAVATDAAGRATVEVKLPDNLTRYRVTVVAVAGGAQFGKAASAITARLPLMVRPSPPRFLNFGDAFELPVVVQNQTDEPMTVDVAVRAVNAVLGQTFNVSETLNVSSAGRRVVVPANDRVEVRFPTTTASAGTARFQVAAVASSKPGFSEKPGLDDAGFTDAATFQLPVYTPATTEAFAVYGVLDKGSVAQPVIAPTGVFTQFGGLEITTSSTALQALTDAVLYLVRYPFECSEQISSRIIAIVALRDVLTAFRADGLPPASELEASIARDIATLQGLQNGDGGFPVWRRGQESWPYHSVHVANALQRAKLKGYTVPPEMLEQAKNYLRSIEQRFPAWYGEDAKRTITAYALNVRKLMGDADPSRARRMVDEVGLDKLSFEAIGWLLPVLSDDPGSATQVAAIRRHLLNRVTETAGAAHFVTSYGDQGYVLLHSDRRADGILLDALIGDQPDSDLIPKLVTGLLAQRKAGKWANTQENSFILLALDRYFNTYEAQTPDFVARLWLGAQYAGETAFRGRTTEYRQINVPMATLAEGGATAQNLILSKDGQGRLYYRLGLRYAPSDLSLPPLDAGFTVTRRYEAVDDPADVVQDADGTWRIKAGARVRVKLTMVAPARRYHVALTDPLPAGLEALNPALATTGTLPQDPGGAGMGSPRPYRWWWGPWYEHQNLHDQRAEAFASLLWEGVHTYSYVARATTPGVFVVPPAKAEEMYAPETFGRSGVDRVVISDPELASPVSVGLPDSSSNLVRPTAKAWKISSHASP